MVLNPPKCEFMSFAKNNDNEVFTYHDIRLKKIDSKKLLGITVDEHLNFNEHLTNVCKRVHCLACLLFLVINRKRLCQTFSSVHNSIIVLLSGYLVLLGLIEKSTNYISGLYDYVKMIIPQALTNFEQTRLSKYSYKKYSAANHWDFQTSKRSVPHYYE